MTYKQHKIFYFLPLLIALCIANASVAQIGGTHVYSFVQQPASATENALGKTAIVRTGDVALALKNPSFLDSSYSRQASITWGNVFVLQTSGMSIANIAYAHSLRPKLTFVGGVTSVIYGAFNGYDEYANSTGYFFASDNALYAGLSYHFLPNFYAGATLKPILSFLETYSSIGILADFAARYQSTDTLTNATIVVRNVGSQITTYTGNYEDVPFGVDIALRRKMKYAPFAISVAYSDLQTFVVSRSDASFAENFLKHFSIATDIRVLKSFDVMLGFNVRKFQDMTWENGRKAVGLSLGATYNRPNWKLSYGWAKQHAVGGTHFFTFSTNMHHFGNKFLKQETL
ncbi:MAG: type IX secretion system protein PorQ [Bacteroidetes bacterium]|nr:type IX secretion system protein PorQ [Bacteroidota bacterium]